MSWKERVFRSLPFVLVLVSAAGVAITEEIWTAIVGLVGMWLLPSPLNDFPNVSRETLPDDNHASEAAVRGYYERTLDKGISAPCVVMHGSAEPHVLGCEGWTSDLE